MFLQVLRIAPMGVLLCIGAALAGCSIVNGATGSIASKITPYRIEIVQGNFVSREQVEALKPGMGRQQVREILGTPLITSLFHDDRWDYVFTLKRPGVEPQTRRLTVFFKGDAFDHHEGDEMPTESEFVASLEGSKGKNKVPQLEATDQQLARFPVQPAAAEAAVAAPSAPTRTYPPLESAPR